MTHLRARFFHRQSTFSIYGCAKRYPRRSTSKKLLRQNMAAPREGYQTAGRVDDERTSLVSNKAKRRAEYIKNLTNYVPRRF